MTGFRTRNLLEFTLKPLSRGGFAEHQARRESAGVYKMQGILMEGVETGNGKEVVVWLCKLDLMPIDTNHDFAINKTELPLIDRAKYIQSILQEYFFNDKPHKLFGKVRNGYTKATNSNRQQCLSMPKLGMIFLRTTEKLTAHDYQEHLTTKQIQRLASWGNYLNK